MPRHCLVCLLRGTLDVLVVNSGTKRCGCFRHRVVPAIVLPEELLAVVVDKTRVDDAVADAEVWLPV